MADSNLLSFFPDKNNGFCHVFTFLGMFPHSKNFCSRMGLGLYSASLVAISCFLGFVLAVINTDDDEEVGKVAMMCLRYGYVVAFIISVIQAFLTRDLQVEIYQITSSIDYLFYRLDPKNDYTPHKTRLYRKLRVLIFVIFAFIIVHWFVSVDTITERVLLTSTFLTLLRFRCIQFVFYVQSVVLKLKVLDNQIKKINWHNIYAHSNKLVSDLADHNNIKSIQQITSRLYVMKNIYRRLWKKSGIVNDCFGFSMLAIIAMCFLNLTIDAYLCYFSVFGKLPLNTAIYSMCAAIPDMIILLAMAGACNECAEMCSSISASIHGIENSYENLSFNSMINDYCLQIMLLPIEYDANGFFKIDFPLLGSMTAAIISYMVILVQFHDTMNHDQQNPT